MSHLFDTPSLWSFIVNLWARGSWLGIRFRLSSGPQWLLSCHRRSASVRLRARFGLESGFWICGAGLVLFVFYFRIAGRAAGSLPGFGSADVSSIIVLLNLSLVSRSWSWFPQTPVLGSWYFAHCYGYFVVVFQLRFQAPVPGSCSWFSSALESAVCAHSPGAAHPISSPKSHCLPVSCGVLTKALRPGIVSGQHSISDSGCERQ